MTVFAHTTRLPELIKRYQQVRSDSLLLAEPYSEADQTVQSMPDASPVKWHLAHTTWFFETFILKANSEQYRPFNQGYEYLFNSYYNSVGEQFSRADRGLITRPGKAEVLDYRAYVDECMQAFFMALSEAQLAHWIPLIELGLAHEQQHQELLVTDIQHALSFNPAFPKITDAPSIFPNPSAISWIPVEEGVYEVGAQGEAFCFDNETPRHKTYLHAFSAADRLVTNAEYQAFMADGGYDNPLLWLSEGWTWKNQQKINSPLYWVKNHKNWLRYTLAGLQPVDPNAPVMHVSYFEAQAYANWMNARLLTEFEWEVLAQRYPNMGYNQQSRMTLQPEPESLNQEDAPVSQLFNTLWQWTGSQYLPYPGFETPRGAVGEYNGKFMSNQFVLRGGSSVTPHGHIRSSYRNFFPATVRWQYTGIRMAKHGNT